MAARQISSPAEISARARFTQPSHSEALQAWADFLAPKEVGQVRLLNPPGQVAHHRNFHLRSAAESARRTPTPLVAQLSDGGTVPEGIPSDLSQFAAHALRDRFPADIEEQIEQAWSD